MRDNAKWGKIIAKNPVGRKDKIIKSGEELLERRSDVYSNNVTKVGKEYCVQMRSKRRTVGTY